MSFLEIRKVTKRYGTQTVLNDVSASIDRGEFVCILGPSGCGKTTLLRIIAGLETADAGQVFIDRMECTFLPPSKRDFGIVFQSYALFPNMTVRENIMFGLRQKKEMTQAVREKKVHEMLDLVEMGEHCGKYPRQLSGGQQQRTAIARALALSPSYLLLDEPLSALDAKVRAKLRAEIRALQRKIGITTIMVTHDQEEALTMADRIMVMNRAVIEQVGKPGEIYNKPQTRFVADFIGSMNFYGDGGKTRGIRPEKIRVVGMADDHNVRARVREVEFKGAFTRIYSVALNTADEFFVDVPSDRVDSMKLGRDSTLCLQIPDEHTVCYSIAG
ncbi:MAG: ATP-binding cassette domain-containing protein [Chitinispirillia bacterium]|nr:ATP-binding cassette domain-containing protein [Chitinispirillia bacterium]MCL2269067.1 ATP-binding cassette domain-containing protein [Chitinispirillia bacterium]